MFGRGDVHHWLHLCYYLFHVLSIYWMNVRYDSQQRKWSSQEESGLYLDVKLRSEDDMNQIYFPSNCRRGSLFYLDVYLFFPLRIWPNSPLTLYAFCMNRKKMFYVPTPSVADRFQKNKRPFLSTFNSFIWMLRGSLHGDICWGYNEIINWILYFLIMYKLRLIYEISQFSKIGHTVLGWSLLHLPLF